MTQTKQIGTPRPSIHFAPRRHWINDPNGLVYYGNRYHLFFQHNPEGDTHGNMSWGHATSCDLVHWQEHPVAISHTEEEEVFSGSTVFDEANSSGLGNAQNPPLVAIYTSAYRAERRQAQSLAYSTDGGRTWARYHGNPVLDRGSSDFRDPKVFRYTLGDGPYWVMVAVEAAARQVVLYRSDDLKSWTYLSSYGPAGAVGGVWECPDLFPLPVDGDAEQQRWVLLISLNPGGVAGGSGTQYVVGQFDGIRFTPDEPLETLSGEREPLEGLAWLDWGRDCYAGVTFSGLPLHERILMAWMSNWDYAHAVPTTPWRGMMTTARRLTLRSIGGRARLCAEPVLPPGRVAEELAPCTLANGESLVVQLPDVARIDFRIRALETASVELRGSDGSVMLTFDGASGRIHLDRRSADVMGHPLYPSIDTAPSLTRGSMLDATIVLDTGSVEIFADQGSRNFTDLAFLGEARVLTMHAVAGSVSVDELRVLNLEAR